MMKTTQSTIVLEAAVLFGLALLWTTHAAAQGNRPRGAGGPLQDLQLQIDDNGAAIDALHEKTTLSDLACATDEIARFDGTQWGCTTSVDTQVAELVDGTPIGGCDTIRTVASNKRKA